MDNQNYYDKRLWEVQSVTVLTKSKCNKMIIPFMLNEVANYHGLFISDIWQFDNFWLENNHKYIQWIFPIDTSTKFNQHAPVVSQLDIDAFKNDSRLKKAQQKSLAVMLTFFGVERENLNFKAAPTLNIKDHIWLKYGGHNHLRISRMIRSLALCDQLELALAFQQAMISIAKEHGDHVNATTINYWKKAAVL
jgi:hypothetical protein